MTAPPPIGTVADVAASAVDDTLAPRVWRWWRSVPTLLADGLLAAVVLAVSLTEVALDDGREGGGAWRTTLLVAMAVVIVFRRRHPIAVWIASGFLVMIYGAANFPDPTLPYAPLIAVYTAAAMSSARVAVRVGVVTAGTVVASMVIDPRDDLLDWLVALLSVTTAWLVGNNVRVQRAYGRAMAARAADLERDHALAAERAAADERLRLARELHDVAAHHVSVIALHAEAGQSLLPEHPDRASDAFAVIGDVARTTLTELRRVVGVLRDDGGAPLAPQPGLRNLPDLVAEVVQAGVPVTLQVTGAPRADQRRRRRVGLPHRAGGADERAAPRRRRPCRGHGHVRRRRGVHRGPRRRDRADRRRTARRARARRDARARRRVRRIDDGRGQAERRLRGVGPPPGMIARVSSSTTRTSCAPGCG